MVGYSQILPFCYSWYPKVINVFGDKNNFKNLKQEKYPSFYNSVTTLISNQVTQNYDIDEQICLIFGQNNT